MSVLRSMHTLFGRGGRRNTAPARPPRRFRPVLESLDDRLVPSNVATNVVGGNLTLTDDGSVSFTLSQPAANQIRITPAEGTTINGQALAVTIQGVTGSLAYNMGAGNDTVTFDLSDRAVAITGDLSITGSSGSKTVLTDTDGSDNFLTVDGNFSESLRQLYRRRVDPAQPVRVIGT